MSEAITLAGILVPVVILAMQIWAKRSTDAAALAAARAEEIASKTNVKLEVVSEQLDGRLTQLHEGWKRELDALKIAVIQARAQGKAEGAEQALKGPVARIEKTIDRTESKIDKQDEKTAAAEKTGQEPGSLAEATSDTVDAAKRADEIAKSTP